MSCRDGSRSNVVRASKPKRTTRQRGKELGYPARLNDVRVWHPWLRINRVLREMLHTRWSAEAWSVVRVEFRKALALRSEIRREWFS